ncbi:MAG TPA: prolipoprotein diacylglyceryl transferase [Candidatus Acidoferrales bacterium]|nr:prolipoprotein diacylglyceryl transferase [Candidatus Acidoferrales bacterium]
MHPILFHLFGLTIYTYGVLVATGVVVGLSFGRSVAPKLGVNPDSFWNMGIYTIIMALVLAKVWLVVSEWDYYSAHLGQIFSFQTFQSGGDFYGGIIGAVLTIVLYSYYQKMPMISVLDVSAAAVPIGHAIGRLGCFAAGCCYGKPTMVPWGITFLDPNAAQIAGTPLGVRLHPTQLYESAAEFLNFIIIVVLLKRQSFKGQILGTYFLLYGIERGVIEFFRGDPGRTMLFHDSVSLMQIVSLFLILTGSILWIRGLRGASPITPASTRSAAAGRA